MANDRGPLLSVRDLKTYYFLAEGTIKAVDGVSFEVRAGKTLGIVGESGCGKSVTARSILGIVERPGRIVEGQILWRPKPNGRPDGTIDLARLEANGKNIRSIRGAEIALIFQEPMTSFSPVHTVGDQIGEVLSLHQNLGRREVRERVIELLRRVGIPRPEQRVDAYS